MPVSSNSKYLRHCTKAEIYDSKDEIICEARVSMDSMGGLLVTVPRLLDYQSQGGLKTMFYDPLLGVVTCRCVYSSPLLLPEKMVSLRCQIVEQLSTEQRREDIKLPLSTSTTVTLDSPDAPPSPAVIRNISAGGVYLTTPLKAEVGQKLLFVFEDAGREIPLTAEILRVEDCSKYPSRPVSGYGCRFTQLPTLYENQLRGYVFQEERRLHSSKRDDDYIDDRDDEAREDSEDDEE